MYTEENEFDYNEYLEDNSEYTANKKSNKGLIIKILIILICLALIIFLLFKFINRNNSGNNNNNDNELLVFNNNISILKAAGEEYFFTNQNLPKNVNDVISVNINDLKDEELVIDIKDYDDNKCSYNTSYISLTKNPNDYKMEINLKCPSMEDSVIYYYDLEYNCLTCNGEEYNSSDKDTVEDNNSNNNQENNTTLPVCGQFSEWTT